MSSFTLTDALTGDHITFDYATGNAAIGARAQFDEGQTHKVIFYPGCSAINYAMPLVVQAYEALQEAGVVTGMSVLCCGKILSYEPDGENIRAAFEAQLRERLATTGIERIVCACPNCVAALRPCLAQDARTAHIELLVLPQVLADLGHRINPEVVARLIKGNPASPTLLCTHDSCPDRESGEFANGLRALMTHELWTDPEHNRARSVCCGSLPRAAGKFEAADACANKNSEEALAVKADAIVTACMSCTFQLNLAQTLIPAVHFLELLFRQRVAWEEAGQWMKLRFLFDETLGATREDSARTFAGLTAEPGEAPTTADALAQQKREAGTLSPEDAQAAKGVSISNDDTLVVREP